MAALATTAYGMSMSCHLSSVSLCWLANVSSGRIWAHDNTVLIFASRNLYSTDLRLGFPLGDANFRFGVGCFCVFRYQHVGIFCVR